MPVRTVEIYLFFSSALCSLFFFFCYDNQLGRRKTLNSDLLPTAYAHQDSVILTEFGVDLNPTMDREKSNGNGLRKDKWNIYIYIYIYI